MQDMAPPVGTVPSSEHAAAQRRPMGAWGHLCKKCACSGGSGPFGHCSHRRGGRGRQWERYLGGAQAGRGPVGDLEFSLLSLNLSVMNLDLR